MINENLEKQGNLGVETIGELRRFKSSSKLPLNTKLKSTTIYSSNSEILEKLTNTKAPKQLKDLKNKDVRFKNTCDKEDMQKVVLDKLNIK